MENYLPTGWIRNLYTPGTAYSVSHSEWFLLAWIPVQRGYHAGKQLQWGVGDLSHTDRLWVCSIHLGKKGGARKVKETRVIILHEIVLTWVEECRKFQGKQLGSKSEDEEGFDSVCLACTLQEVGGVV